MSYLGPFTGPYRKELTQQWMEKLQSSGLPHSQDFALSKQLADAVQVREWQLAGLPTDNVSTDNAIFVLHQKRWPMLIDPQVR